MHLRFSLKHLRLTALVLAAVSYWCFVRPSAAAHRFAEAVAAKQPSQSETFELIIPGFAVKSNHFETGYKAEASVSPRMWYDIWKLQRRIL